MPTDKKNYSSILAPLRLCGFIALLFLLSQSVFSQQRFPKPEFETGYIQPNTTTPEPRSLSLEYVDVAILIFVMSITAWLILKKRSRRGVFWLVIFTILYFGFYRDGCICSVGSVQNVALSLFSDNYTISLTILAFFLLPLVFSLFFGRVFCAAACPLGAIQDLTIIKPISLPKWLQQTLGLFPFIYLTLAVLYAVTGTEFIICRFDPFVGIFRMGARFNMVILGIGIIMIGFFIARPYCRFICPYGALLKITSFFSKKHITITPSNCIQCKLCSDSCPFDAIEFPTSDKTMAASKHDFRKFILYLALIPVWIAAGGFALSSAQVFLSKAHPHVYLSELFISNPETKNNSENLDIKTFMSSGKSIEELNKEAEVIKKKFKISGWYLGGFLGLVIGITLLNQVIYRKRTDYQPNKGNCVSCGRCMDFCPVKD